MATGVSVMGNVFDLIPSKAPKATPDEPKVRRSRKRENLSGYDLAQGKLRLSEMVDRAFATLETAMLEADYGTAIKAAQVILDRAGFGPRSTLDVNTVHLDLSNLSREQLAERAGKIAEQLRNPKTIDSTPISVTETVN